MKLAEIFAEESWPPGPPFPLGFTPQALWRHEQALKNPVSGLRGCYIPWSSKKGATGKQNSLMTVEKPRSGLPRSLLLRVIQTAFSHYCRWRSSGLPSLATAGDDQVPKAQESGLPSLTTAGDHLSMSFVYLPISYGQDCMCYLQYAKTVNTPTDGSLYVLTDHFVNMHTDWLIAPSICVLTAFELELGSRKTERLRSNCRSESFLSVAEVPTDDKELPLRRVARLESNGSGQGFNKCNCTKGCRSVRCKCLKNSIKCNSKGHNSLTCANKWLHEHVDTTIPIMVHTN